MRGASLSWTAYGVASALKWPRSPSTASLIGFTDPSILWGLSLKFGHSPRDHLDTLWLPLQRYFITDRVSCFCDSLPGSYEFAASSHISIVKVATFYDLPGIPVFSSDYHVIDKFLRLMEPARQVFERFNVVIVYEEILAAPPCDRSAAR